MAARVPTYDTAQVEARPLPGARQESVATPDMLGSAANSEIREGEAIARAGTGIAAVALHMAEKENLRKVQDASTAYGARVLDWQAEAQKKRIGAGAQGLVTDFSDFHKKQIDEIAATLDNDAQRLAFKQHAQKSGLAARHSVATFETQQMRQANIASYEANVANNINLGAVAITPESVGTFRTQVVNGTKAFAASQNFTPEMEQALLDRQLTEFHAQRIQQLARTAPAEATAYFEANKGEIAGSKRAEIGEFAQKATAEITGVTAAGELWAKFGPDKGLDVMEEEARKMFKNDPYAMKATITSLRERTSAYDKGQQERADNVAAAVNRAVLGGASPSQIRAMPEFIALSNMGAAGVKTANSIIDHAENKDYSRIVRATASEARQQQILARRGFASYLDYSNPDKLAGMSEAQIVNLLPTLGNELTGHLMTQKRGLVKNADKIVEARIDQQDFDHIAQGAGLKPFAPHKSEDDKAYLGELKFAVEQKINAAQIGTGKPLARADKMKLMQEVIDNKVLVDRTFLPDPEKPAALLKPDELSKAYVVVDGKEIKLSSIPKEDRLEIITELRKRGRPASEAEIARIWSRVKGPK